MMAYPVQAESGVMMMNKTIQVKGRPVERVQVCLVPVPWGKSV